MYIPSDHLELKNKKQNKKNKKMDYSSNLHFLNEKKVFPAFLQ